jgi:hypothetical protein
MELKRNSWHYRIAHNYGGLEPRYSSTVKAYATDLCTYTQKFAKGLLGIALLSLGIGLVGWAVLDFALWLYVITTHGDVAPQFGALFTILALIVGTSAAVLGVLLNLAMEFMHRARYNEWRPPSAAAAAYQAWKDKYCLVITLKGGG